MSLRAASPYLGLVSAAAVLLFVTPSLADAYSVRKASHVDITTPEFNGKRLVWLKEGPGGRLSVKAAALRAHAPTQTLYTFPGPSPNRLRGRTTGLISASPSAFVVRGTQSADNGGGNLETFGDLGVFAGVGDGPVRALIPAAGYCGPCEDGLGMLDGYRLLTRSQLGSIEFLDVRTGARRSLPIAGVLAAMRGRFLVSLSGVDPLSNTKQVIVYDTVAQRERYRLSLDDRTRVLGVLSNGTVLFSVGRGPRQGLAWASPEAPSLHRIPARPSSNYSLRIAKDRVVFSRPARENDDEVGVLSLTGRERVLARSVAGVNFDGHSIVWGRRGCRGVSYEVSTLRQLEAGPQTQAARCPLELRGGVRVVNEPRKPPVLDFEPACLGFSENCSVYGVRVTAADAYRVGGKRVRRGSVLGIGEVARIDDGDPFRAKLNAVGARLLRSRARTRVRLSMRVGGPQYSRSRMTVVARGGS